MVLKNLQPDDILDQQTKYSKDWPAFVW